MEFSLWAIALACGVSLLLSGGSICWILLYSIPARFKSQAERAETTALAARQAADDLRADWLAYRVQMEGLETAIEGTLDSVERKRRQVSGAVSRLNATEEAAPQTRGDIIDMARRRVYGGQT